MQVADLVSKIKELLRKQVRLQAVELLHTDPLDSDGDYICLPSAFQSQHIPSFPESPYFINPTQLKKGEITCLRQFNPYSPSYLPSLNFGLSKG